LTSIADIVKESVVEEGSVLRDNANASPKTVLSELTEIRVTDPDDATERVIEAEQKTRDGGLATASRTNNGCGGERKGSEETRGEGYGVINRQRERQRKSEKERDRETEREPVVEPGGR
jgi:hypothetical protein